MQPDLRLEVSGVLEVSLSRPTIGPLISLQETSRATPRSIWIPFGGASSNRVKTLVLLLADRPGTWFHSLPDYRFHLKKLSGYLRLALVLLPPHPPSIDSIERSDLKVKDEQRNNEEK